MKKSMDKGWIIAIIVIIGFIASFYVAMANPALAEVVINVWIVMLGIGMVAIIIGRIWRIIQRFR